MSTPKRSNSDHLYPELTAVGTPPLGGTCTDQVAAFPDHQTQQAVFDGEFDDPDLLDAARGTCASCPVLAACRRYADDGLDDTTFLAGTTAMERSRAHRRSTKTRRRKAVVARMREAGVTVDEIVFYTKFSKRSIEGDIAELAAG
ncbi:WhiB family transcriptional regulator [Saccharothrix texasensis]|uniref:WhiB family transcriptional regulator n=1 Tax=Saccharothrix texasensis TaxID=103734 RepID=UPI000F4CB547|nr:WhiB family transcriptional regulator [Saccharothrix texasensis]